MRYRKFTKAKINWGSLSLGCACVVLVLSTAQAAIPTGVEIDQTPLTSSKTVAPNIMLMMDDSGSMAWGFMPDWGYMQDTGTGSVDSQINGVYYNPKIDYTPPPMADGTLYPNSPSIDKAYRNGFTNATEVNVLFQGSGPSHNISYGNWFVTDYSTGSLTWSACPTGFHEDSLDNTMCDRDTPLPPITSGSTDDSYWACYGGWTGPDSSVPTPQCSSWDNSGEAPVKVYTNAHKACPANYNYNGTTKLCDPVQPQNTISKTPSCGPNPRTSGTTLPDQYWYYDRTTGTCYYRSFVRAFRYWTGPKGSWQRHLVAIDGQCADLSDPGQKNDCIDASTMGDGTNGAPSGVTVGQNVANWFSYYRTRMLTAKTGLMKALAGVQPDIRFGFGSINGNGLANIPAPMYEYDSAATGKKNELAEVQPFGDGSSGTQKAKFWAWLANLPPAHETPLREALNNVGKYYETSQPWQSDTSGSGPASGTGSGTDDPELACRQSYTILTTDGFWNGPGQTIEGAPSDGNIDGHNGTTTITSHNMPPYKYIAAPPFSDSYSNTLADIAMHYWKTDLQPNMPNEVPPGLEDPAFWQHMGLFTLGMGFQPEYIGGTVDDGHGGTRPVTVSDIFKWINGGQPVTDFSWPEPSANNIRNIADVVHAAVNGHGGYYSALDPASFTAGIKGALQRIQQRVGSGASFGANSASLHVGSTTYQALYSTGKWNGDLQAFNVDPSTGVISNTSNWGASAQMPDWKDRNVWTYNPKDTSGDPFVQIQAGDGTELSNTLSKLSDNEKEALGSRLAGQSPTAAAQTTEQEDMLEYLLGDHSLEMGTGGPYRSRNGVLGDIVNSQPVYVGAPNASQHAGNSAYQQFASDEQGRTPAVWVAANDGMLHAFDAKTGKELFAYLPGSVITSNTDAAAWQGIANLADPDYGSSNPHEYFNDGRITIADAYIANPNDSVDPTARWRTVLVATTGRGPARAIYAIDITNPKAAIPLWERAAADGKPGSNYIGQNISTPVVAQTANGWQVFMGNGYNSNNNEAALLQFNLATGDLTVYPTDGKTDNALAPPSIWIGNTANGYGTIAYAGDLLGRVWSFDLTDPGSTGTKLFTAEYDNKAQPITAGMLAGKDPKTNAVWIFFGTGKYLTHDDLNNMSMQTWYGLIVQPGSGQAADLTANLSNGRAALAQRFINSIPANPGADPPQPETRVITTANAPIAGKSGWYIDLQPKGDTTAHGERIVVADQFQSGWLLATTRLPEYTTLCNPTGTGWVMAIDPFTGGNPESVFFDLNGDDIFTSSDEVTLGTQRHPAAGIHFDAVPNAPVFVGSRMLTTLNTGSRSNINTAGPTTVGMVSWRELVTN